MKIEASTDPTSETTIATTTLPLDYMSNDSNSTTCTETYEWKTHSDHDYDWNKHNMPPPKLTLNDVKKKKPAPAPAPAPLPKKKPPTPTGAVTNNICNKRYKQRNKAQQKLLEHQTAALIIWLENQGLKLCATKLRKGLEKELEDAELPTGKHVKGTWKFVKSKDYDTSSSEEEDSDEEEEETSSGEFESSSEEDEASGKKSPCTSGSEYEEDMSSDEDDDDDEEVDTKPKAKVKVKPAKKKVALPTRSQSFEKNDHLPQRGVRRCVSFDEGRPTIHEIPSKPTGEDKKRLYYDKQEIRRMRQEDAVLKQQETEEKLQAAMREASANFGVILPGMKL